MKYKLVYAACFIVGFMAAPAWRLAPVYHWQNLNEVTNERFIAF